jgi:hypothetical protein
MDLLAAVPRAFSLFLPRLRNSDSVYNVEEIDTLLLNGARRIS